MPARNRNPIQMSRVSLACLALLAAVCGGYFALVPFLRALEPSPPFGAPAPIQPAPAPPPGGQTGGPPKKPTPGSNQLRPKTHHVVAKKKKAKKPAHKHVVTVPTRPTLVNRNLPTSSPSRPSHAPSTPTRTQPTRSKPHTSTPHTSKPATTPSRSRGP